MTTRLNRCLNEESKYYGLSSLGLIGGAIVGGVVLVNFGMAVGVMGFVVGFSFFSYAGTYWHKGIMQRFMYWHLPLKQLLGCKCWPDSSERCLS